MAEKPASGSKAVPLFASFTGGEKETATSKPSETHRFLTDIYQKYVDAVYRYHYARLGDVSEAQDLTSETFHATLVNIRQFDPGRGTPGAWIMGIARRKLADHFRRNRSSAHLELPEDLPDRSVPPEVQVTRRLDMRRIAQALKSISPARAEALALHFFGGLSIEETAQAMNKRQPAVKKLVQRGLGDMRRVLWTMEESE